MRVLQLVTRDEPGGVQVLTEMVARGLVERGHEIETRALDGGTVALAVAILSGRHDAILSYQVAAGLFGSFLGTLANVPVRATHLTALPEAMRPHWRWLDRLFGRLGLHSTIVANSVATVRSVDHYPAAYRQRLKLIPHGVEPLPRLHRDWRALLDIPALAPLLVASGRLVAQKAHATAVAALPRLPNAHLVIAGDGELRTALIQQAEALTVRGRLHLVGNLDRSDLASLLDAADVYLFPSVWESFGLAGVEAAMLGLPVVASDLPVLREVLTPAGAMAQFHAVGDVAELTAAVETVLAHYPTAADRAVSSEAMQAAHAVSRMIDDYCRLIDGRSRIAA